MELSNKAAYLQGLVDGLGVDESTKEGKIIKAMAALLGEMADAIAAMDEDLTQAYDQINDLSEELEDLEADFVGVSAHEIDGKVYYTDYGMMTATMYYNKAMWAAAGLTEADIPKTWDQFREVAKKLTIRDENGELLPDGVRLTKFGRALRSTSLDELPELWNIFKGDMSIVGPRPQLVRDMVFMTPEQRLRHTVMPGLTGLAQVSGRNAISWEDKLATDLRYIRRITFLGDVKIVLLTVKKVFCREDISADGMDTAEDLGDYLHRTAQVSEEVYQELQAESKALLLTAGK